MTVSGLGLAVHTGQPAAKAAAEGVRRWAARHVRGKLGLTDAAAALADGSAPAIYAPAGPLPPDLADPGPRDDYGDPEA